MTSERMSSDSAQISERERDILRLVAMGATNQQIANQLNISINTVKVHLRNIFEKIGAASRTEATVFAIRQGLVQLDRAPEAASALPGDEPPGDMGGATPIDAPSTLAETSPAANTSAPADTLETAQMSVEPSVSFEPIPQPFDTTIVAAPTGSGRARLLLFAALGLVVLLTGAVAYLLMQRQTPAPTTSLTPVQSAPLTRWKSHSAWAQPRTDFAIAAADNKLYLIGGAQGDTVSAAVDRYDPSKDQLVALNAKPTAVRNVRAVTLGGKIYVPGGEGQDGKVLAICEAYDPRTKQWESLPPLPAPRSRYALADFEGQLYLFGGWDGTSYRAEVFVLDPRAKTWAESAPMRTPRANAGAALVEERIYVIGGENQSGPLTANERFDPTNDNGDVWESVVPLSEPVMSPAVVGTVNSVLLFDPQKRTATEYSPTADAWQTPVPVPDEIGLSSRAAALSTSIFLFGPNSAKQPGAVSEYQVLYSTLVPIINN